MWTQRNTVFACLQVLCVISVSLAHNTQQEQVQFSDFTSWSCLNNASCTNDLAIRVAKQLNSQQPLDLGIVRIQPIEPKSRVVEGRSVPSASLFDRNAIQVPIGPIVLSFERSDARDGHFQVSVVSANEARSMGEG